MAELALLLTMMATEAAIVGFFASRTYRRAGESFFVAALLAWGWALAILTPSFFIFAVIEKLSWGQSLPRALDGAFRWTVLWHLCPPIISFTAWFSCLGSGLVFWRSRQPPAA